MKRMLSKTIFFAMLVCGPSVSGQSFSSMEKLLNCTGAESFLRKNNTMYTVICYHDNHNCSSFVVEGLPSNKKFATSTYASEPSQNLNNYGYIVKDMELLDGVCWFCGEKWAETGRMLYTLEGLAYPEVTHYGFIGRFNMADVTSGSGNFEIMIIPGTGTMTHLAVYTGGVTAIGQILDFPYTSYVVELQETSFPGGYIVGKYASTREDEVFMDVARAGGKVVTLSRFNDPIDNAFYSFSFGLRYGTATNYANTANTLYQYKTNKIFFPANIGQFYGLTPIFLTYSNIGNGVVVSYLGGGDPSNHYYSGHLLMANIPSEGANTVNCRINYDMDRYSQIKEVHFNNNHLQGSRMAILVEDNSGNSTFRFPRWDTSNRDTILYTNNANLESFTYYYSGNDFSILGTGNNTSNNIISLWQDIDVNWPLWNELICMQYKRGHFSGDPGYDCVTALDDGLVTIYCKGLFFSAIPFMASNVWYQSICTDGTTN